MGQPVIELQNVSKTYTIGEQTIHALDQVSLIIEDGEFSSIIGPSGSGKSTLMHLLGCLDTPTSGTVLIDGTDVSRASSNQLSRLRNQKIGFVFQSFNLLSRLNVYQNVELPMVYSNLPPAERHDRAMHAIQRVGLEERLHNRPMQLSGGQCQRVAIARAIVNQPKIILADEPTGNLDSKTGASILELFEELNGGGRTIILVTHDNHVAQRTPTRIVIKDGKIADPSVLEESY